jgi:succinate dehydrogenase hydrophobic anchor subunit
MVGDYGYNEWDWLEKMTADYATRYMKRKIWTSLVEAQVHVRLGVNVVWSDGWDFLTRLHIHILYIYIYIYIGKA